MVNSRQYLCLLVVFLVVSIDVGSCLECYLCSEIKNNKCADPFDKSDKSNPTKTCEEGQVCGKFVSESVPNVLPQTRNRGCVPTNYCAIVTDGAEHCSTCDKNLCNSGSTVVPSLTMVALFLLKYFWS